MAEAWQAAGCWEVLTSAQAQGKIPFKAATDTAPIMALLMPARSGSTRDCAC